jgi:hypothetical protein
MIAVFVTPKHHIERLLWRHSRLQKLYANLFIHRIGRRLMGDDGYPPFSSRAPRTGGDGMRLHGHPKLVGDWIASDD